MHTTVSTKFVSVSGTHTLTKKTGERKKERKKMKKETRRKYTVNQWGGNYLKEERW